MAELADAHDSKSCGKPCGFESHHRHQKKHSESYAFKILKSGTRKGAYRSFRQVKACMKRGKNVQWTFLRRGRQGVPPSVLNKYRK